MTQTPPVDPSEAFAGLGRTRLAEVDLDAVLNTIAPLAMRAIPGADEMSVTLLQGNEAYTPAFMEDLTLRLDELQNELAEPFEVSRQTAYRVLERATRTAA